MEVDAEIKQINPPENNIYVRVVAVESRSISYRLLPLSLSVDLVILIDVTFDFLTHAHARVHTLMTLKSHLVSLTPELPSDSVVVV